MQLLTNIQNPEKPLSANRHPQLLDPGSSLIPSSSSSEQSKLSALVTGWIHDVVCVTWLKRKQETLLTTQRGLPIFKRYQVESGVVMIIATLSNTEYSFLITTRFLKTKCGVFWVLKPGLKVPFPNRSDRMFL